MEFVPVLSLRLAGKKEDRVGDMARAAGSTNGGACKVCAARGDVIGCWLLIYTNGIVTIYHCDCCCHDDDASSSAASVVRG